MRWIVIAGVCLALGGCGTKYQEMGFTGGVAAQQMTADTWRIQSRGNAYTNSATVQDYVLLKAAETAQAAGGTHFQIISAADASRASTIVSPGTSNTTFVGNQAFTTTSPGSVDTVIRPGQDVYVRVLKLPPGPTPQGVYSAQEIIQFVGSRVERPR
ncbi:CC0125/CC1285 family lipoprotein [Bradyrhizobium sp. 1.29L]